MSGDLDGLMVVSLEQAVAAPFVSSRLAAAGARVIKLERKSGDFARYYDEYVLGMSAYFVWLNAGKESVIIDIKNAQDIEFLYRLLAKADVFIQNLAPGASARAGLGASELSHRFPALIICEISGYGSSGPYRNRKAYDLLVQAESGLAALSGGRDEPGRVGVSVCDIACGMYAHSAILQALYARQGTGKGRVIEVSLYHSMADWMNVPYLQSRYGGHIPQREGLSHPTIAPYGTYMTADNAQIAISVQNETEWGNLCNDVLQQPSLRSDVRFANNPSRVANRHELDGILAPYFASLDRKTLSERLTEHRIAFGHLSTLDDLLTHPQSRFTNIETPNGAVELLSRPPIGMNERQCLQVPALGEHDAAVRAEFRETNAI